MSLELLANVAQRPSAPDFADEDDDAFVCSECKRSFGSKRNLNDHYRSHHEGTRPHVCSFPGCSKSFLRPAHLAIHFRIHTGEKPFECDFPGCGKRWNQKSALKQHMRSHTGEKPFTCTFAGCNKSFSTSSSCKRHVLTHTAGGVASHISSSAKPSAGYQQQLHHHHLQPSSPGGSSDNSSSSDEWSPNSHAPASATQKAQLVAQAAPQAPLPPPAAHHHHMQQSAATLFHAQLPMMLPALSVSAPEQPHPHPHSHPHVAPVIALPLVSRTPSVSSNASQMPEASAPNSPHHELPMPDHNNNNNNNNNNHSHHHIGNHMGNSSSNSSAVFLTPAAKFAVKKRSFDEMMFSADLEHEPELAKLQQLHSALQQQAGSAAQQPQSLPTAASVTPTHMQGVVMASSKHSPSPAGSPSPSLLLQQQAALQQLLFAAPPVCAPSLPTSVSSHPATGSYPAFFQPNLFAQMMPQQQQQQLLQQQLASFATFAPKPLVSGSGEAPQRPTKKMNIGFLLN